MSTPRILAPIGQAVAGQVPLRCRAETYGGIVVASTGIDTWSPTKSPPNGVYSVFHLLYVRPNACFGSAHGLSSRCLLSFVLDSGCDGGSLVGTLGATSDQHLRP